MKLKFLLFSVLMLLVSLKNYSQIFEKQGAGVSILVHGWDPDGNQPSWMTQMANTIIERNGNEGHIATITVTGIQGDLTSTCSDWNFDLATQDHAEIIVLVNWTAVANHLNTGITAQEIAAAVAPKIYTGQEGEPPLAELPIHLIGHSRGGGMIFEIARLLGLEGVEVEHLTALDPHPLTAADPQPVTGDVIDTPIEIYENILFVDNYYQTIEFPMGEYVDGAYNRLWTSLTGGYHNETGYTYNILGTNYNFSDHLNIILAYHGTIDLETPTSNGEATMTQNERDAWFNSYENEGENTGFKYSRQIMGNRKSADIPNSGDAVIEGYHNDALLGGNGVRENLNWTNAVWPNLITAVVKDGEDVLLAGTQNIPLNSNLQIDYTYRSYANASDVTFFVDVDRNPYNNNNATTATTENLSATGNTITASSVNWTVEDLTVGEKYYLYAEINDGTRKRFHYLPYEFLIEDAQNINISAENIILIYPNPTTGILVIASEAKQSIKNIKITDITGKIILSPFVKGAGGLEIDLTPQPSGIYLLKIETEKGVYTEKIIKQ